MSSQHVVYDACRHYINDNRTLLGDSLYRRALGLIRARSFKELAKFRDAIDISTSSVDIHRCCMQVEAFFSKNAAFSEDSECVANATSSFLDAELLCYATNERLDTTDFWWEESSRSWIMNILGDFSEFKSMIPDLWRLTGGATSTRRRRDAQPVKKMGLRTTATPGAAPYLSALYRYYGFGTYSIEHRIQNRVAFVPKTWKTHRTIAAEPDGNLPLQLSFDTWVKRRLAAYAGIDLSDQSRNRDLARLGSLEDGTWCTIDLSAASDTLAMNLVAKLLPDDWYEYLNAIRSPGYVAPFGCGVYQKFSSMGNGATFGLETLIFASLVQATGCQEFSVYGDDIVIPFGYYDAVVRALNDAGFLVNTEKSYHIGPFRESCGGNYHCGVDITPFRVRKIPTAKAEWCHFINGLVSIGLPGGNLWDYCLGLIRDLRLPIGPPTESTLRWVQVDSYTAYRLGVLKWRSSLQDLTCKGYVPESQPKSHASFRVGPKLFRWYLLAERMCDRKEFLELSREPAVPATAKYRLRRVSWRPPAAVGAPHLWMWSDQVFANS
jgi:hypothetical protein